MRKRICSSRKFEAVAEQILLAEGVAEMKSWSVNVSKVHRKSRWKSVGFLSLVAMFFFSAAVPGFADEAKKKEEERKTAKVDEPKADVSDFKLFKEVARKGGKQQKRLELKTKFEKKEDEAKSVGWAEFKSIDFSKRKVNASKISKEDQAKFSKIFETYGGAPDKRQQGLIALTFAKRAANFMNSANFKKANKAKQTTMLNNLGTVLKAALGKVDNKHVGNYAQRPSSSMKEGYAKLIDAIIDMAKRNPEALKDEEVLARLFARNPGLRELLEIALSQIEEPSDPKDKGDFVSKKDLDDAQQKMKKLFDEQLKKLKDANKKDPATEKDKKKAQDLLKQGQDKKKTAAKNNQPTQQKKGNQKTSTGERQPPPRSTAKGSQPKGFCPDLRRRPQNKNNLGDILDTLGNALANLGKQNFDPNQFRNQRRADIGDLRDALADAADDEEQAESPLQSGGESPFQPPQEEQRQDPRSVAKEPVEEDDGEEEPGPTPAEYVSSPAPQGLGTTPVSLSEVSDGEGEVARDGRNKINGLKRVKANQKRIDSLVQDAKTAGRLFQANNQRRINAGLPPLTNIDDALQVELNKLKRMKEELLVAKGLAEREKARADNMVADLEGEVKRIDTAEKVAGFKALQQRQTEFKEVLKQQNQSLAQQLKSIEDPRERQQISALASADIARNQGVGRRGDRHVLNEKARVQNRINERNDNYKIHKKNATEAESEIARLNQEIQKVDDAIAEIQKEVNRLASTPMGQQGGRGTVRNSRGNAVRNFSGGRGRPVRTGATAAPTRAVQSNQGSGSANGVRKNFNEN